MNVGLFTELFHPHVGGSEKRFYEIGRRLVARGHEVHVFTIQHERSLPAECTVDGIHIHRYAHSRPYLTPGGRRSLRGVLRYAVTTALRTLGRRLDVCYFNQWPLLHTICAKPFTPRLVQDWCEVWFREIVLLERLMSRLTPHHVAVSHFTRRRLIDFLHVTPEVVTVIPNGVDCRAFRGSGSRRWGRIVYVGRLVPHKRVDLLIDAFPQVKARIPASELHIVGSGPLLPALAARASRVPGVHVHGFLPELRMQRLVTSSWLHVSPSEREGSGIAALESMAAGLPVLTVNAEGNAIKELAGEGCCVVTEPDADRLAFAICALLDDDRRWRRLSRNAQLYAARHDWDRVAGQAERYLRHVAGG